MADNPEAREFCLTITADSYQEFVDAIHAAHKWTIENPTVLMGAEIDVTYSLRENAELVRIS